MPGAHEPGCQVEVGGRGRWPVGHQRGVGAASQGHHTGSAEGRARGAPRKPRCCWSRSRAPGRARVRESVGRRAQGCPSCGPVGSGRRPASSKVSLRKFREQDCLLPTGRTFVSGQPNKGRKPRVLRRGASRGRQHRPWAPGGSEAVPYLGAGGAGLEMATARPPAGAPRALLGP